MDRIAATYCMIAFEPRSECESRKTTSGNTPEMRAQDLHNLLQTLGARHPVLIGWSQGVQISPLTSNITARMISPASCWWTQRFQMVPTESERARKKRRRSSKCLV